jgi:hypothetical protein
MQSGCEEKMVKNSEGVIAVEKRCNCARKSSGTLGGGGRGIKIRERVRKGSIEAGVRLLSFRIERITADGGSIARRSPQAEGNGVFTEVLQRLRTPLQLRERPLRLRPPSHPSQRALEG